MLPAAFGLLNTSLLNVSKVKTGYVTCARLVYKRSGRYAMHVYSAEAKEPPAWNEYGWGRTRAAAGEPARVSGYLYSSGICGKR